MTDSVPWGSLSPKQGDFILSEAVKPANPDTQSSVSSSTIQSPQNSQPSSPVHRKRNYSRPTNSANRVKSPPNQRQRASSPPDFVSRTRRPLSPPIFTASTHTSSILDSLYIKKRTDPSTISTIPVPPPNPPIPEDTSTEDDPVRLKWRQRQVEFGKNTDGYKAYLAAVPLNERKPGHPVTPPLDLKISKKKWGYLCNNWRRDLHHWDPIEENVSEKSM
ncbi:hypothetical protein GEMRC1_006495 [Eukaryota sp. GEM-RC1]